jgi:hypothetical protein
MLQKLQAAVGPDQIVSARLLPTTESAEAPAEPAVEEWEEEEAVSTA